MKVGSYTFFLSETTHDHSFKEMLLLCLTEPNLIFNHHDAIAIDSDADAAVIALGRVSIHRCALICKDGSAVTTEANISDIPTEIPSIYDGDDTELNIRYFVCI